MQSGQTHGDRYSAMATPPGPATAHDQYQAHVYGNQFPREFESTRTAPSYADQSPCLPMYVGDSTTTYETQNRTHDDDDGSDGVLQADTELADVSTKCLCISQDAAERYLPVVVSISVGAYFGVGMRIVLTEFANWLGIADGALLRLLGAGVFLPNVVGCVVMGFVVRCKPLLRDRYSVYVTGITTGFCGCCTTFASWDVVIAANFVHGLLFTGLLLIGVQVGAAFMSYRAGYHAAELVIASLSSRYGAYLKPSVDVTQLRLDLKRYIHDFRCVDEHACNEGVTRRIIGTTDCLISSKVACDALALEISQDDNAQDSRSHRTTGWAVTAVILLLWLWIPPFVGLANYSSSRLFALTLAPFGALLRYYLSLFNSQSPLKDFPLYTFLANVSASILSCLVILIGSATLDRGGAAYRSYEFVGDGGILVGFCGSLSTVSTWVSELDTLSSMNLRAAYRYAVGSVALSQLLSMFILGLFIIFSDSPLLV